MAVDFTDNFESAYLKRTYSAGSADSDPFTMPLTIFARFKLSTLVTGLANLIAMTSSNSGDGFILGIGTHDGGATNYVTALETHFISNSGAEKSGVTTGVWFDACAVFASTSSRVVYLNGVAGSVDTANIGTPGNITQTTIGLLPSNFPDLFASFHGCSAELAVYDAALSGTQVSYLHSGNLPSSILQGNLKLYGKLFSAATKTTNEIFTSLAGDRDFTYVNTAGDLTTCATSPPGPPVGGQRHGQTRIIGF